MEYTLEERRQRALDLKKQGHNCCQSVAMAFGDVTATDDPRLSRLSAGVGSGFGGKGEVCGAITGATMVAGMAYDATKRPAVYGKVRETMDAFANLNGSYICRELKGPDRKPCAELITDAVEILHRQLEADGF